MIKGESYQPTDDNYYKKAYEKAAKELSIVKSNLRMHKELIQTLANEKAEVENDLHNLLTSLEEKLDLYLPKSHPTLNSPLLANLKLKNQSSETNSARIIILEKIIAGLKNEENQKIKDLEEECQDLREQLERKEYFIQLKEKKWANLEKIVVGYAYTDFDLRKKLDEIKYICDDPSTMRKISTVVFENEELKSKVENQEKEMSELKTQLDIAKSNLSACDYIEDDLFGKGAFAKSTKNIFKNRFIDAKDFKIEKKAPSRKMSESKRLTEVIGNKTPIKPPLTRPSTFTNTEDNEKAVPGVNVDNVSPSMECSRCKQLSTELKKRKEELRQFKNDK